MELKGTEVNNLPSRRRKNRHVQLQLDLEFRLLTEVARKEEAVDSFNTLPQALLFKLRISPPDPFFQDLTGHHII